MSGVASTATDILTRLQRNRATGWVRGTGWPWLRARSNTVWSVARPLLVPVFGSVSGFGWGVLVAGILAAVFGLSFGWLELVVIAVVCAAALLVSIGFAIGRSSFRIALDLAANRVVVGEQAVGRITVANAGTRATLPARIELPVGSSFASFHLPRLAPGAEHDDLFGVPTSRRSVITVGPVRSVRGDPLGLLRREVRWTEPVDLFVHPRTINLEGSSSGFLKDLEGLPSTDLSNNDVSFHALREYVPGDDRRYIHWKTSARTGTLMVRQFEETRRSHLAIALSTSLSDYRDDEEFELAVSTCGSLGVQALREERDVTVLVQGSTLHSETGRRLLDDLSAVEATPVRDTIVQLAKVAGQAVPNASVAVLVYGGDVTPTELQAASVHLPLGVRVIAVSCIPGSEPSRRQIGDLAILTIGDLSDLPAALRRVNKG
ncbi:DUF58 domain-containing protein [Herbiconiux sp. P16]|uniref:DUF58 domain-containing protein n=1 Tax=Herbiconiux wuyangfengii TaxID=3342794 RepID=UPI0035B8166B